jgi:hypothetical protein
MSRKELEAVIDYILNRAEERELEVIAQACKRRARDAKAFASLGGENPGAMARRMASELERGVGASMENVRGTVRDFVAEIIRKNAPEVTGEQLEALLDEYAPPPGTTRPERASSIPPEVLMSMVESFVDYSKGAMPPSKQRELWETSENWQQDYWTAFPSDVKALVKAYIEEKIDAGTFTSAVVSVLGL